MSDNTIEINGISPILAEQLALFDLRKKIAENYKGAIIEIKETSAKADYIRVAATITVDGKTTSICEGYALPVGSTLTQRINAEIVALCGCLTELGTTVTFTENAVATVVQEVSPLQRLSFNDIMNCSDVASVFYKLKAHGIDATDLKLYQEDLNKQGARMNVSKAAKFLFPDATKAVYTAPIVEKKPKADAKTIEEKPQEPKEEKAKVSAIRSGAMANEVTVMIAEKDLEIEEINAHIGTSFRSIFEFAQSATDEQVEQVRKWQSQ